MEIAFDLIDIDVASHKNIVNSSQIFKLTLEILYDIKKSDIEINESKDNTSLINKSLEESEKYHKSFKFQVIDALEIRIIKN